MGKRHNSDEIAFSTLRHISCIDNDSLSVRVDILSLSFFNNRRLLYMCLLYLILVGKRYLFITYSRVLKSSQADSCRQEDHEIFDLVTELEAAEGKATTFYSWLEVPSTASTAEIAKAYRKKSMQLQSVYNSVV